MRGTLLENRYKFFIISRTVLLRMGDFQTQFVEKIKTHIS